VGEEPKFQVKANRLLKEVLEPGEVSSLRCYTRGHSDARAVKSKCS